MPTRYADRIGVVKRSISRLRPRHAFSDAGSGLTGSSRGSKGSDGRQKKKRRWVLAVITVLIISSMGFAIALTSLVEDSQPDYNPHGVIIIDGHAQLQARALENGWPGDGSDVNPFIIEGYEIFAIGCDEGICVRNTSYHIVIQGCYVHDAIVACISLFNVTNVTVASTRCANGQICLEVASSALVSIISSNCTLANEGIRLTACDRIAVRGSNCSWNLVGMNAQGCSNLSVQLNSAHGNVISAFQLNAVKHFLFANNTCYGGKYGVSVALSEFGSVRDSTSADCSETGLYLDSCNECCISDNVCRGHDGCGISIQDCVGCCVRGNEVLRNGHGLRGMMCNDLDVLENEFRDNRGHGMDVEDSIECSITDNRCRRNGGDGMVIEGCQDVSAERNRCEGNGGSGLRFFEDDSCRAGNNTCADNGDSGIGCQDSVRCSITGNDVGLSEGDGLRLSHCDEVNVSDNICHDADSGIRFSLCGPSHAYSNTIADCALGIAICDSVGVVLRRNAMAGNGVFIEGSTLDHWGSHEIGPTNSVNDLPVAYMVSSDGITVPGTPGQVILVDCLAVTVEGLDLSNATVGVELAFSDGIIVRNTICSDGYIGVYGYSSPALTVEDSDCSGNIRSGVELVECPGGDLLAVTCDGNLGFGIRLNASSGIEVAACVLNGSAVGISTESVLSAGLLDSNSISNCSEGVRATSTSGLRLFMNEVTGCGLGVRLMNSTGMVMTANALVGCGLYIESDSVACWNSHVIDSHNSVNGRTLAYVVGESEVVLSPLTGQAVLVECDGVTASALGLSNCTAGVLAGFSSRVRVTGCNLSDNMIGAEFVECNDCEVRSNLVRDCLVDGVRLRACGGSTVDDNDVSRCGVGIIVRDASVSSAPNRILDNNVSENQDGIVLNGSPGAEVERNVLLDNLGCGVVVQVADGAMIRNNTCNGSGDAAVAIWGSAGCVVANNTCFLNRGGICFYDALGCNVSGNLLFGSQEYGIFLYPGCSENRIWSNALVLNNGSSEEHDPLHAQARDDGLGNQWNSSGTQHGLGNYWYDWAAPDDDMDGIVDAPYNVSGSANAKDYRPLASAPVPIEPIP